jgi:hypothetical protein
MHSGMRRRLALAFVVPVLAAAGLGVSTTLNAGALGTNGDPIIWAQTQCFANVSGHTLAQNIDITVQDVVENQVAQGAAYTDTVPGGSATLPSTASGTTISAYKNINQTFLYRSSTGIPVITSAAAAGTATNNGNPVVFNVTFTNVGAGTPISTASWANTNGGFLTFTTTAAHGLSTGQVVDSTGNTSNPDYNFSAQPVGVPSSTTFTLTGRSIPISAESWSAAAGGTITYTTSVPHKLLVGQHVTTLGSAPALYNRGAAKVPVAAVLSDTQFTIAGVGTTDPGPATTLGTVDSLGNPGAIGAVKGNVNTVAAVTLSTPNAVPGDLTTPDVNIGMIAPNANATVTTYTPIVTTTATTGFGDAATSCRIPHDVPQTDGISATLVGTGGPTTSAYPTCRPPDVCATTSTTIATPAVTSVSPSAGPTAGGTSVAISGTGFTGATAVSFGGTPATSFTVNTATSITATAPAHALGTVDVTVTTAGGTSATSANDQYA